METLTQVKDWAFAPVNWNSMYDIMRVVLVSFFVLMGFKTITDLPARKTPKRDG